jgi:2'-5' RNA ligase
VRLFVALDLPAAVRTALVDWAAGALDDVPGVRLLAAESLHVTLCFLGDVDAAVVPEVAAACEVAACEVAGGRGPVALRADAPLWLPARRPRVAAVALGAGGDGLADLQAAVGATLAAGGWYRPERRPFLAHVTVARIRGTGGAGLLHPPDLASVPALRFIASSVTLYRSHTGPPGARYEPLTTIGLRN